MKNWKKLVAILLVGVMALAMLTACGGGAAGGSTVKKDEDVATEQKIMVALNEKSGKGGASIQNNGALKDVAWKHLTEVIEKGDAVTWNDAHRFTTADGKLTYINVATSGSASNSNGKVDVSNVTNIESDKLLDWLEQHGLFHNVDVNVMTKRVNVGVVAKKVDGKIYVAVAVSVTSPFHS